MTKYPIIYRRHIRTSSYPWVHLLGGIADLIDSMVIAFSWGWIESEFGPALEGYFSERRFRREKRKDNSPAN